MKDPAAPSHFLRLPVELRLEIYKLCCFSGQFTISSRPRSSNESPTRPIPGLPEGFVPAISLRFDRELLESHSASCPSSTPPSDDSIVAPSVGANSNVSASTQGEKPGPHLYPSIPSLRLVCRQINDELVDYQSADKRRIPTYDNVSLYISYPAGVSVVVHQFPHLLRMASSVNVTGSWDLTSIKDPGSTRRRDRQTNNAERPSTYRAAATVSEESELEIVQLNALEILVDTLMGKKAALGTSKFAEATTPPTADSGYFTESNTPTSSRPSSSDSSSDSSSGADPASGNVLTIDPPRTPIFYPSAGDSNTLTLRIFHPNKFERPAPRQHAVESPWGYQPTTSRLLYPLVTEQTSREPQNTTRRRNGGPARPTPSAMAMSQDPYALLWSHTLSPSTATLACIYGGEISLSVSRGRVGNGVQIVAKGNGGRGRCVSCHWPRLDLVSPSEYDSEAYWAAVGKWLIPEDWGSNGSEDIANVRVGWED